MARSYLFFDHSGRLDLVQIGSRLARKMRDSMIRSTSAWTGEQIDEFLRTAVIPVRLACVDGDGMPLVCSLWFLCDDDTIWCATQASAHVVRCLSDAPRCGFEIAPESPPYRGVRGQGSVSLSVRDGADVLARLIDRYLGSRDTSFARWLIERSDNEVAIRIDPHWVTAWDFSQRMRS